MEVRKSFFTGSEPTRRILKKLAAESSRKNVPLELGGQTPQMCFPMQTLKYHLLQWPFRLLQMLVRFALPPQGEYYLSFRRELQAYTANYERIYVHKGVADSEGSFFHLQAGRTQFERAIGKIERWQGVSAELVLGGKRMGKKGYWINLTVIYNMSEDAYIQKNEIF
ncbi:hypothetical protein BDZ91DRAFT_808202, partial [Kalaharituber pfeilii]